ncbi:TetR/AcrR family transcriptional regulator [Paenarthrobacter sp. NPDC092416]|uniref:TetR/AcrR family transcriptional regulator n=1 Tax=Paenarthrobacter sp. NPDC092416 TaxID=3364386 RepID=UPI00380806BD
MGQESLNAFGRGTRGKYVVSGIRRQQILNTAENLVLQDGHRSVTMKRIAAEVGVRESTLYHHFPSRDAVLLEVLRRRELCSPGSDSNSPFKWLISIISSHPSKHGLVELYLYFASRAAEVKHPAHDYLLNRHNVLTKLFTESSHYDEKMTLDPRLASQIFIALIDGLLVRWVRERDSAVANLITELSRALAFPDAWPVDAAGPKAGLLSESIRESIRRQGGLLRARS